MAIALGPFVISLARLFLLAGVVTALLLVRRTDVSRREPVNKVLWSALLIGLATARLAYVASHAGFFIDNPIDVLKVWEGGFSPLAGGTAFAMAVVALAKYRKIRFDEVGMPAFAGVLVWSVASWIAIALSTSLDQRLPDLVLETVSAEAVTLSDFTGEPVVINLWATWCPPCRREMPVLEAAERSHPGVRFLFINQGEDNATINRYLEQEGLALDVVLRDPFSKVSHAFNSVGLPTTLFFDASGQLVTTHIGELTTPSLTDYLNVLRQRSLEK